MRTALLGVALGSAGALTACGDKRTGPPHDQAGSVTSATALPGSAAPSASVSPVLDEGPPGPPPSGGPWESCADGFRISGHPLRDVTRLGLLCGPVTGLRAPAPPTTHLLAEGESAAVEVTLGKGECVRVFATARDPAILTLSTSLPAGPPIVARRGAGFVSLRPSGPLCTEAPATLRVILRADRPTAVALAAWILPL